jgi:hypothetical protein
LPLSSGIREPLHPRRLHLSSHRLLLSQLHLLLLLLLLLV